MSYLFLLQDISVDPEDISAIKRKGLFAYVYLKNGTEIQSQIPEGIELEDITRLWVQALEAKRGQKIKIEDPYLKDPYRTPPTPKEDSPTTSELSPLGWEDVHGADVVGKDGREGTGPGPTGTLPES